MLENGEPFLLEYLINKVFFKYGFSFVLMTQVLYIFIKSIYSIWTFSYICITTENNISKYALFPKNFSY